MITINYLYYNNHELFNRVRDYFWNRDYQLLFVDDGSQREPLDPSMLRNDWRLVRVNEDLPWSYNVARNVAMKNVDTPWALCMDLDHVPNEELLSNMKSALSRCDRRKLNLISRVKYTGELKPHYSQYIVWTSAFWQNGGYQEETTGYGQDFKFRRNWRFKQLNEKYKLHEIADGACDVENRKGIRDIPLPGYTWKVLK